MRKIRVPPWGSTIPNSPALELSVAVPTSFKAQQGNQKDRWAAQMYCSKKDRKKEKKEEKKKKTHIYRIKALSHSIAYDCVILRI
jgi:hypothetical protein